jgi:pentatricopeptide repeat protein
VLELFEQISIEVDEVIIMILFNACAKLSNNHSIQLGKDVLNRLPSSFLENNKLINSAIDMLMKFGHVEDAERLLREMKKKDSVTFVTMMQGYSQKEFFIY